MKFPDNFIINPQIFQLRPPSDCYEKTHNYGLVIKRWDKKVIDMLPEVRNIVKDFPMSFSQKKPDNRTVMNRYLLIRRIRNESIVKKIGDFEKYYLNKCLKLIKKSSIVKADLKDTYIYGVKTKDRFKTKFSILYFKRRFLFLNENEVFILRYLDGSFSVSEISHKLFLRYNYDKKKSFKTIMTFLSYLVDNNISIQIKITR